MADLNVVVLSPLDLRPGSVSPEGRVVEKAEMYITDTEIVVGVRFTDGGSGSYLWPSGKGWTVNGKVG